MTKSEAVQIARRFVADNRLPAGHLADTEHTPAAEHHRVGCHVDHGDWAISFHYAGPLKPAHPQITLRMDVGWLFVVLINDITGEAQLWQNDPDRGM